MKGFLVGFAKKKITPDLGCLLSGYPTVRNAQCVLDPLSVGTVAICQGGKTLLLISAEICIISKEKCDEVRKIVADAVGIASKEVFFFTTHTHSGPITKTTAGWGEANEAYLDDLLVPRTIETAKEALCDLQEAVMGVGVVESKVGINRRQITQDGIILGQNPDGPYDPAMTVIQFQTPAGKAIGSIIHFAAHPTAAGANSTITRDWPGYMEDRIEKISGAGCIYLNGAQGDIGPRLSNGMTTGDDSYVREIGLIAEADAQKAYEAATEFFVPQLHTHTGEIFLPYAKAPGLAEVQQQITEMGDPEKLIEVDVTKYAKLQRIKKMYEAGEPFPDGVLLEQTVVALGDYAFIPAPFEAFSKIAMEIKASSPFQNTLFLGLANGGYGYLPTSDEIPYGGYEVDSFHAAGITGFPDDTDKRFVAGNIQLLNELYQLVQA